MQTHRAGHRSRLRLRCNMNNFTSDRAGVEYDFDPTGVVSIPQMYLRKSCLSTPVSAHGLHALRVQKAATSTMMCQLFEPAPWARSRAHRGRAARSAQSCPGERAQVQIGNTSCGCRSFLRMECV